MSLASKVTLVTGCSSGIGAAIAQKFIAEGAKVVIVDRNESKLREVSAKCEQRGGKPVTIVGDVTNDDTLKKIVDDTVNLHGQIDVLVNNAGISGVVANILSRDALKNFDSVMAVNIRSLVSLTNLAAPHIVKSKGNIINISSAAGLRPFQGTGFAYNTSKAAVDHFTRSIALELAKKGVRVNSVNPGPVKTDIIANMGADEAFQQKMWSTMKSGTALDRISDPEEVADLVEFLASDKARGITGASFVIDNGIMLKA